MPKLQKANKVMLPQDVLVTPTDQEYRLAVEKYILENTQGV